MLKEAIIRYQKAKFVINEVKNKHTKEFIDATDNLIAETKLESELERMTYLSLHQENEDISRVISEYRMSHVLGGKLGKNWLAKAMHLIVTEGYNFTGFSFTKGDKTILNKSI